MNQAQALVTVCLGCAFDSKSAICCMLQLPQLQPGDSVRVRVRGRLLGQ